jgi:predicted RNA-binding Zn-ribbon protein involved in translation (DUF1610 family)
MGYNMNVSEKYCPKCGRLADWKTYIQKYVCTHCGWTGEVKSVFRCNDCHNFTSFEVMKYPGNDDLIYIVCKECGSVAIKHQNYLDEYTYSKLSYASANEIAHRKMAHSLNG